MTAPLTSIVAGLPASVPFVGPEALERARGRPFRARLGANESAFGPAPGAITAMHAAATEGWKYGDPENYDLKQAIAARHGVTPAHVVVGEGIDALFGTVARLHVEPGVAVVSSLGAYPTFAFHIAGNGGRLVTAPYRDDREDIDALLALARAERPRLVFLANPDNPMGSWWDAAAVEAFAGALSSDVLLCLDEAYADFAPADALPAIDPDDPRVLRFRTFSKAHGMAGLRVGYAVGAPEVVAAFDRVRNHFGVNRVAQAGALASLADEGHIRPSSRASSALASGSQRSRRTTVCETLPSATNFVAVDCGRDGTFARAVLAALAERDVFIRMPGVAPLDRCIRDQRGARRGARRARRRAPGRPGGGGSSYELTVASWRPVSARKTRRSPLTVELRTTSVGPASASGVSERGTSVTRLPEAVVASTSILVPGAMPSSMSPETLCTLTVPVRSEPTRIAPDTDFMVTEPSTESAEMLPDTVDIDTSPVDVRQADAAAHGSHVGVAGELARESHVPGCRPHVEVRERAVERRVDRRGGELDAAAMRHADAHLDGAIEGAEEAPERLPPRLDDEPIALRARWSSRRRASECPRSSRWTRRRRWSRRRWCRAGS